MKTQAVELVTAAARGAFWTQFNQVPDRIGQVAYRVPTDMKVMSYAWLGDAPGVREWVGSRLQKSLPEQNFTITNKLWESTIAFDYFTISSPQGGAQAAARGGQMGQKAAAHPYRLALSLLNSGGTSTCYDGKAFFATTHSDAGAGYTTNQSNSITKTGLSSATAPVSYDMLRVIREVHLFFLSVRDSEGDEAFGDVYGGIRPLVVAHPSYIPVLNQVLTSDTVFDSSGNEYSNDAKDTFDLVASVRLDAPATTPAVYGLAVGTPRFPFIFQEHTPVALYDNSDQVLQGMVPEMTIRSAGAHNVGFGDWRCAAKVTLST